MLTPVSKMHPQHYGANQSVYGWAAWFWNCTKLRHVWQAQYQEHHHLIWVKTLPGRGLKSNADCLLSWYQTIASDGDCRLLEEVAGWTKRNRRVRFALGARTEDRWRLGCNIFPSLLHCSLGHDYCCYGSCMKRCQFGKMEQVNVAFFLIAGLLVLWVPAFQHTGVNNVLSFRYCCSPWSFVDVSNISLQMLDQWHIPVVWNIKQRESTCYTLGWILTKI